MSRPLPRGTVSIALAALLFACTPARSSTDASPAPKPSASTSAEDLLREGNDTANTVLRDAVDERVGVPDLGPAEVVKSWTWRPRPGSTYAVWSTCRGAGDTRACALSVGVASIGKVDVKAHAATGWSPVKLAIDGGPGKLRVDGDDGRGAWTQTLEAHEDGSIAFGPRIYPESP